MISIFAKDLEPGHQLYLRFMGGSEYIDIDNVYDNGNGTITWKGYNPVTGGMSDTIGYLEKVNIYVGEE